MCIVIIFRNIIEKSYSDLVLKQRYMEGGEQDSLLREFRSAKDNSWSQERQERRDLMQQGNVNNVIMGLCVIIIVLLLVLGLVSWCNIVKTETCLLLPVAAGNHTEWSFVGVVRS